MKKEKFTIKLAEEKIDLLKLMDMELVDRKLLKIKKEEIKRLKKGLLYWIAMNFLFDNNSDLYEHLEMYDIDAKVISNDSIELIMTPKEKIDLDVDLLPF